MVNFNPFYGDKQKNTEKIIDYSIAASEKGANIVLFPEMCLTGYDIFIDENISSKEKRDLGEVINGKYVNAILKTSKNINSYIVFGMPEIFDDNLYNTAIVAGPEGLVGAYRKIHPYDKENCWCKKGDSPFYFQSPWGPIAIGICYDTYQFPELMRYYAYKGCRLYLNPTALAEEIQINDSKKSFIKSYTTMIEYGVLANSIFIASSNLAGYDGRIYFGGGSMIMGPKITPFKENDSKIYCGDDKDGNERLHVGTIDLSLSTLNIFRENSYTHEPDFRPDIYIKLYENLV